MAKLIVKDTLIRTLSRNGIDYICITDIARQKNPDEPKDVVKNWMRVKNTLEYLGLWESLNNPDFKGIEFDPIMREAGSNSFTMSPSRWIELTGAIGIISKLGREVVHMHKGTLRLSSQVGYLSSLNYISSKNSSDLKKRNRNNSDGLPNASYQS